METPLVSICCISYNHERYIKDALDGFVMQKTNFPFEIVISDDCSKDATRDIITEYKAKHPTLIRDVSPEKNMGAIPNFLHVQKKAIGKYVAICEGDDFWVDPYKLQKQVDFLETHSDYVACFHNAYVQRGQNRGLFNALNESHYPTTEDIISRRWFIATASLTYRKELKDFPEWGNGVISGDYLLELLLAKEGKFYYMDDVMSVYRVEGQGISTTMNANKPKMYDGLIYLMTKMKDYYNGAYAEAFDRAILNYENLKKESEIELYFASHPIARALRPKTYKRAIKQWLQRIVNR